jgi:hypothetical protein
MASTYVSDGLSSSVGILSLPTTTSICAWTFSWTSGCRTMARMNVIKVALDCSENERHVNLNGSVSLTVPTPAASNCMRKRNAQQKARGLTYESSCSSILKVFHPSRRGVFLVYFSERIENHGRCGTPITLRHMVRRILHRQCSLTILCKACLKGTSTQSLVHSLHISAFFLIVIPGNHEGMFRTGAQSACTRKHAEICSFTYRKRPEGRCYFRRQGTCHQLTYPANYIYHAVT